MDSFAAPGRCAVPNLTDTLVDPAESPYNSRPFGTRVLLSKLLISKGPQTSRWTFCGARTDRAVDADAKGHAKVAELVDALDLGSSIERCESSSLSFRTIARILPVCRRVAGPRNAGRLTIQQLTIFNN